MSRPLTAHWPELATGTGAGQQDTGDDPYERLVHPLVNNQNRVERVHLYYTSTQMLHVYLCVYVHTRTHMPLEVQLHECVGGCAVSSGVQPP